MNPIASAWTWLMTASNWSGPSGIAVRLQEHIGYSLLTLAIACLIGLPIGWYIGHTGRGKNVIVPFTGALRALPTLGLITVLALLVGFGLVAPLIALVLLALPPIIAGTYAGIENIDPSVMDAARAQGFSTRQLVTQVEAPLASPLVIGGIRSALLQVIATWTVAAFLPNGGLGRFLIDGLAIRDYAQMLGGSILVIALALIGDLLGAAALRLVTQRFVTQRFATQRFATRIQSPVPTSHTAPSTSTSRSSASSQSQILTPSQPSGKPSRRRSQ